MDAATAPRKTSQNTPRRRKNDPDDPAPATYDRQPPVDLECEKGVIGSIFLDPHVCDEVLLVLDANDFHSDANRVIYRAIIELHNKGRKPVAEAVHSILKQQKLLDEVGGLEYLLAIADAEPHAANAVFYAKQVRDAALKRRLIYTATETLREAYDGTSDASEMLQRFEQRAGELNASRCAADLFYGGDVAISLLHRLKNKKPVAPGIRFFIDPLDQVVQGMHPGQLILIAARTSVGKTALATTLVANQLMQDENVCYFCSLEMGEEELIERVMVNMASVDSHRFRNHWCGQPEIDRLAVAVNTIMGSKRLYIDRAAYRTVQEVVSMARRAKRIAGKLDYVVVDYLQLMESSLRGRPRHEQVSEISRRLKIAAKELNVPVIALAQLNREADEGRPRLKHLRESGSLEQDSDIVIFIDRDTKDAERQHLANVYVDKVRNNPPGECQLAWFGQFQRFQALAEDANAAF
jgi:replicative DNA helicase